MAVVTAIKKRAKPGSTLFQIFLDDKFAFSLSDLELSNSGLRVGSEVTPEEAQEFVAGAKESRAYSLALRYLGVRPHSRRELAEYLQRKDCTLEEREAAIARLESLGLVDDAKFAESWVASRMALRPRSRMHLAQELTAKGVARDTVDSVLAGLDGDTEKAALKAVIERKRRLGYGDKQKLVAYLQRQGYRWSLIKEALEDLEED